MTYCEKARRYADDVLTEKVAACRFVKAAAQRQESDLEKFKKHPVYVWSPTHADHICSFIERLPHVKGPKANRGEFIQLEDWQCFVLTTVFGWRRKDNEGRRFRRTYIEVPRGNAKSTLSSGVALYMLGVDGEMGGEIYSAATTRDQARITWGDAYDMMKRRPDFAKKNGYTIPRTKITSGPIMHTATNSKFLPLSRESTNLDGLNIHLGLIDELHAHKTRDIYDVLETGAAKRNASMIWSITTAGSDTSGICYEVRGYTIKILEGTVDDDNQFGIIYTIDDADDWTDPAAWRKANPNWGISVMVEMFQANAQKAMAQVSAQNNFKTKHLCCWVNAAEAWMDMRAWERAGDPDLSIDDFINDSLFLGLDLATKVDIASKAKIFTRMQRKWAEGKCDQHKRPGALQCRDCYQEGAELEQHYYLFVTHYLPESAVEDGHNSQYEGWAIEGWLTKTPGDVTDYTIIQEGVVEDLRAFRLRECAYDPWQSAQLAQNLENAGVTTVEVRQTTQNMSQPMKEFEALVLAGRLHHNADPVMRWMISNVVCHRDAKDNIFPKKEQPQNKIDGVVASITALSRALVDEDPYASGGLKSI